MTFTSAYDILTCFELASPRHHHIKRTEDKGNMENNGVHGGSDHKFVQHTAPLDKVFIIDLDGRTSYPIMCLNCDKWGNCENQCP